MRCVSADKAGVVGPDDPRVVDEIFVGADGDLAGSNRAD